MSSTPSAPRDVAEVIEIRDPAIDVQAVMAQIRANLAQRRAQGAYRQDLDAVAQQVFAEVMAGRETPIASSSAAHIVPLAELQEQWAIREPAFTSQAPVVGPLIVGVRTAWNWMSTKWYVRIIVQQIQNFHLLTVRAFQDIDAEHRQLAEQVQRLEALSEHQAQEIVQLRAEVEWLRGSRQAETESGR